LLELKLETQRFWQTNPNSKTDVIYFVQNSQIQTFISMTSSSSSQLTKDFLFGFKKDGKTLNSKAQSFTMHEKNEVDSDIENMPPDEGESQLSEAKETSKIWSDDMVKKLFELLEVDIRKHTCSSEGVYGRKKSGAFKTLTATMQKMYPNAQLDSSKIDAKRRALLTEYKLVNHLNGLSGAGTSETGRFDDSEWDEIVGRMSIGDKKIAERYRQKDFPFQETFDKIFHGMSVKVGKKISVLGNHSGKSEANANNSDLSPTTASAARTSGTIAAASSIPTYTPSKKRNVNQMLLDTLESFEKRFSDEIKKEESFMDVTLAILTSFNMDDENFAKAVTIITDEGTCKLLSKMKPELVKKFLAGKQIKVN